MIVSPFSTCLSLPTRVERRASRARCPASSIPTDGEVRASTARTALLGSLISITRDTFPNTFVTWPTRPGR